MSEENVERARRLVDAWNRRDLEAFLEIADPEVEFINSPTAVEPGTRRGVEEGTAVLRAQWEMLLDARQEIDRIYDRGDEVILLVRISRGMPGSEARLEEPSLFSLRFREGKLTRTQVIGFGATEVREAMKAAGLDD
jgi:ketosteroid isomerase-like protein